MTQSDPFECDIKALYSDFVVQEISPSGVVASPTGHDLPNVKEYEMLSTQKEAANIEADKMTDEEVGPDDRL